MSNRLFVKICPVNSVEAIDLELPADESIHKILPDLLKVMDQPSLLNGKPLRYALKTEEDELLVEQKTLAEAGIEDFQKLWLTILVDKTNGEKNADSQKNIVMPRTSSLDAKGAQIQPELPRGLRGIMSAALWSQLPIENPSLVSSSGLIFELGDPPIVIGRYSKDCSPTIDLTELDTEAISSRPHVEINVHGEKYVLRALKTKNGTFVNNIKLDPNGTVMLKDGDTIMFGIDGVKLVFCMPKR